MGKGAFLCEPQQNLGHMSPDVVYIILSQSLKTIFKLVHVESQWKFYISKDFWFGPILLQLLFPSEEAIEKQSMDLQPWKDNGYFSKHNYCFKNM